MSTYIVRRLLIAIPTLLIISFVLFAVLSLAPGDPLAQFAANPEVPQEVRDRIAKSMGLDKPWYERYPRWLLAMLQGDFGFSYASRAPVNDLITQRLPQTLKVIGIAYLLSVLVAIPVGVLVAVRPHNPLSIGATTLAFIGFSMPTFFTGLLFIIIFSVNLRWFPMIYDTTLEVTDLNSLWAQVKQSIMPIMVLALFQIGALTRFVRASMLENLQMDYARTARAKGLRERVVIMKHVLRNSLIPIVTLIALGLPAVFTGAIVTEQVFRIQGIGELLITSLQRKDIPVVMAVTFIAAVLIVLFNTVADIVYGVLDPRIKLS
jgi:peptide/nickel transport system permease protein